MYKNRLMFRLQKWSWKMKYAGKKLVLIIFDWKGVTYQLAEYWKLLVNTVHNFKICDIAYREKVMNWWGKSHFMLIMHVRIMLLLFSNIVLNGISNYATSLCSLGLVPCNFWLFLKVKEKSHERKFTSDSEIVSVVQGSFKQLPEKIFRFAFKNGV